MKTYLIHGDYTRESYCRLNDYVDKAREKGWKTIYLTSDTGFSFQEALSSKELFSEKKVFILENPTKLTKKDITWLNKNSDNLDGVIVFYNRGVLKSNFIKSIEKLNKVEEYKLPQNIFTFLDSFCPGNQKKCLKNLHDLLQNENIEFIFYLLSKHLRDLFWVKISPSTIPYPSWRVGKLERQSSKFSLKKIKEIINGFSEIDIKSKTSDESLLDLLDLLIIRKLE